ncbi:kinase-like protein [Aureobasidium namibiae CBS 147.97]|uniref:non-specific serine/threonine protein kinase n=1 Tax=Aureobasidium namibiae CBS 147.97 TaxID=1043004 RepID=A0A074WQZ3_9PEZI
MTDAPVTREDTNPPTVPLPLNHTWIGSTEAYTVPVLAAAKIPGTAEGWRTYMDYFSKGDFSTVIREHTSSRPLPEPFLWFTFERMAKALVAMDTAFREPGKDEPVVIHNDIKPGNILMGYPGSLGRDADYISYPPAYVGDFGMSYLTSGDTSWTTWLGRGTRGYFAPEADLPKADPDGVSVLSFDDVGLVYTQDPAWEGMIERDLWAGYSQDLIDIVEYCVQFDMAERPSPQTLLASIQETMPQYADGMDRWGTLSWVKQMSSEIDDSLAAEDATQMDDDAGTGAATGEKRKASGPVESAPDAKRIKAQTALDRRLAYVATLIQGVKPRPQHHKDDESLMSRWINRLIYKDPDAMFSPDEFFNTADSSPIEYFELENEDANENHLDVIMVNDGEDDGQTHQP